MNPWQGSVTDPGKLAVSVYSGIFSYSGWWGFLLFSRGPMNASIIVIIFNFQELFEFHDRRAKGPLCVSVTLSQSFSYFCLRNAWFTVTTIGIIDLLVLSSQEPAEGYLHFHAVSYHYLRVGQRGVPSCFDAARHGGDQSDSRREW